MTEAVIKVLAVCLISAAVCILIKNYRPEFSFAVGISAAAVILIYILSILKSPIDTLISNLEKFGVGSAYIAVALKCLGIGYITTFVADTCRDNGQSALASKAEFVGKAAIFVLLIPLLSSIAETAIGFLK